MAGPYVEAVFDTSKAIASLNAYYAAIQSAIKQHASLGAASTATTAATAAYSNAGNAAALAMRQQMAAAQAATVQLTRMQMAYVAAQHAAYAAGYAMRSAANAASSTARGAYTAGRGAYTASSPVTRVMLGLAAGWSAKALIAETVILTDRWTDLNGRIRLATTSTAEFNRAQTDLFEIAQRGRIEFSQAVNLFSRISEAGRDMGVTTQHATTLVQIITDAGRASHRTSSEIKSFLTQFPQAIAAGKLSGDEMRAILESFPNLITVIAKNWQKASGEFGITRGELQRVSRDQKAYIDLVINAMIRGQDELRALAERAPRTFEQAAVQMKNSWLRAFGEMADQTGFTDRMTAALDRVTEFASGPGGATLIQGTMNLMVEGFEALTRAVTNGYVVEVLITIREVVIGLGQAFGDLFDALREKGGWAFITPQTYRDMAESMSLARENAKTMIDEFREAMKAGEEAAKKTQGWVTSVRATPAPLGPANRPPDKQIEDMQARIKEQIRLLEHQIKLEEARSRAGQAGVIAATANLEVERQITDKMREKLPVETAKLEALIRQKEVMETQREIEQRERPARERLAQIREETELKRAEMTGDQRIIDQAQLRLRIEKQITEDLRQRSPELALQLEAAERHRMIIEQQARAVQEWTNLYERMGDTLVNAFMQAGKEGRSFSDGLRDAAAQFSEMLLRAIVLEPLVKSIASALAGKSGTAPSDILGGLFRSIFGSGSQYIGNSGGWNAWMTPMANRASSRMSGQQMSTTNFHINVAGDMTEATRMALIGDMRKIVQAEAPGIVKTSVQAVRREHQASRSYLAR